MYLIIVIWLQYTIVVTYENMTEIARLYGPDVHTGLPLALGKASKEEV